MSISIIAPAKVVSNSRAILLSLVMLSLFVGSRAQAVSLYWDANGVGANTGGTGTWNTTDPNTWRLGSALGAQQAWDNGTNGNSAYLAGTVGALTLGSNITVAYLNASSGYSINGDGGGLYSLTFDSTLKAGGDGGSYGVMSGGGNLTINAPVVLAGSFNHDFRSNITFNGVVSGTAGFLANFATVTLNNTNPAFSGGFKGAGTLVLGNNLAAGTGDITLGSSLQATNGARTIKNRITPSGGNPFNMTIGGTDALTLDGGAGTGTIGGNGITINVNNSMLTIDRPLYAYSGAPLGVFNKNGTGTLVLNESSSSMVGATGINVNVGTLLVNGDSVGSSVMSGVVTNGSTVITGLASTAGLRVGQQVTGLTTTLYPVIVSIDSSSQVTLAAPVTSASGTPNLTFAAVGGLGYNAGNINVAVNATLGGSGELVLGAGKNVTINPNATLRGTLTINLGAGSVVNVNAGATLAPGASVGTLTVNGDILLDGTLANEVSGISTDLLVTNGDLTLGATSVLDIIGTLTAPSYTIASYSGTLLGTFGTITGLGLYEINYGTGLNSSITLEAVPAPEPSSLLLLGFGALGLLRQARRRRSGRA